MRVLHLCKTSVGAGWAARQMISLVRKGYEVAVVIPERNGLYDLYVSNGVQVYILPLSMKATLDRKSRVNFREIVGSFCPDLIHSHFVSTTLYARYVLGRNHAVPRIFQVPGPLHVENALTRSIEIGTSGANDYWLGACQETCARYVNAGVSQQRVGIAYYGGDWARFDGPRKPPADLQHLAKPGRHILGMVGYAYAPKHWLGQIRGVKGHEDLIEATRILIARGWDLHAIFVGAEWGNGRRYFESIVSRGYAALGERAHFVGTREDIADFFNLMDIAVHPSHSENLGGAADSLFLCRPTVATRTGGFPDIVIPGHTGRLAKPRNPLSLADEIEYYLRNPAVATSEAKRGREVVMSSLTLDACAAEIVRHYDAILSKQTTARNSPIALGQHTSS